MDFGVFVWMQARKGAPRLFYRNRFEASDEAYSLAYRIWRE